MNNLAELITVAKYWRQWRDGTFIVCVLNNQDLNQVTWEQRVMEGNPKAEMTLRVPDVAYHRFAELIGLNGIYVDRPEGLGPAWEQALAAKKPVLIEVKCDPEVPPLPPHISLDQARNFMTALMKGDPAEAATIKGSVKQIFADFIGSE